MRKFTKTLLTFVSILTMLLVGCSTKDEVLAQESTEKIQMPWFAAGTYVGKADGYTGHIEVSVTVDEINILSIEIEEINDSYQSLKAADVMIDKIIEANKTDVDTISGATVTTTGIQEAVQDALNSCYVNGVEISSDVKEDKTETVYKNITAEVVGIIGLIISLVL